MEDITSNIEGSKLLSDYERMQTVAVSAMWPFLAWPVLMVIPF